MLVIDYADDDIEYFDDSMKKPEKYKEEFLAAAQHLVEKIRIFNEMYSTNFFG